MRGCPSDEIIFQFARGELSGAELASTEAHVHDCADCRRVVADTAGFLHEANATTVGGEKPSSALAAGATVDRYVVDAVLGQGGMGVVYAAHDPRLNRRIALKVVRSELDDPAASKARLLREAQAMAQLQHPNVVAVHDVGVVGEQVYLAMELVEGETLRAWLRGGRSATEVTQAFVQAGRGLQAAHEVGLVHRDFKPENVMVGRDGRVRVTDFGLARPPLNVGDARGASVAAAKAGAALATLTGTGVLAGTPAYMAPEQLFAQRVDARADQFSFCVSFYEALCGERPFKGSTLAELTASVVSGELHLPKSIPDGRVLKVLRRGLLLEPGERFSSMAELLDALEPPSGPKKKKRSWAPVVAVPVLAAAVAFALWPRPLPPSPLAGEGTRVRGPEPAPEPAPIAIEEPQPEAVRPSKPTPKPKRKRPATPPADDDATLEPSFMKGKK